MLYCFLGGKRNDLVAEGARARVREKMIEVALVLDVYETIVENSQALVIEQPGKCILAFCK